MGRETPDRTTVQDLCRDWQSFTTHAELSPEADYRIRKLVDRTTSIVGKMFLKTVKGQELISLCAERTQALRDQLAVPGDGLYQRLTALEECYEELLKKTHEFRVKAG